MSPTAGGTCATEDMKMRKAGLMGLNFPYHRSILFHEVWRSKSGWGSGGEGALLYLLSPRLWINPITPLIIQHCS